MSDWLRDVQHERRLQVEHNGPLPRAAVQLASPPRDASVSKTARSVASSHHAALQEQALAARRRKLETFQAKTGARVDAVKREQAAQERARKEQAAAMVDRIRKRHQDMLRPARRKVHADANASVQQTAASAGVGASGTGVTWEVLPDAARRSLALHRRGAPAIGMSGLTVDDDTEPWMAWSVKASEKVEQGGAIFTRATRKKQGEEHDDDVGEMLARENGGMPAMTSSVAVMHEAATGRVSSMPVHYSKPTEIASAGQESTYAELLDPQPNMAVSKADQNRILFNVRAEAMAVERTLAHEYMASKNLATEAARAQETERRKRLAHQQWELSQQKQSEVRRKVPVLNELARLAEEEDRRLKDLRKAQLRHNEHERYIAALRESMLRKMEKAKVDLPPLCSCGLDPFEDHASGCANNCRFYRNPEAYRKALSDMLFSVGG